MQVSSSAAEETLQYLASKMYIYSKQNVYLFLISSIHNVKTSFLE